MPEIFLSYRRVDAPDAAGRLFDRLSAHFGADQVFRDIETIEAGRDFERAIRDAIEAASAVLIVIGPRWTDARDAGGTRRLDDPDDYVRREVELALASKAFVIPVLVDDAAMPADERLPASIGELARKNALELSHRRWRADVDALICDLEKIGIPPGEGTAGAAEASGAIVPVATTAIVRFLPNLAALIRRPRAFLRRYTFGRRSDLTVAAVFFIVALLVSLAILIAAYTPDQGVPSFALAVFVVGALGTLAVSLPLWIGWSAVGARRHYSKLLVVLLHQAGVLHLAAFAAMAVVIFATDLDSRNIVPDTLAEAMQPGQSVSDAVDMMRSRFEPLAGSGALRVALPVAGLLMVAGMAWLVASWGAYRDAFEMSRGRSLIALMLAIGLFLASIALTG